MGAMPAAQPGQPAQTRFADPARCPDCGAALTPGSFVCPSCRIDLGGELGQKLFVVLTEADRVLDQLRQRRRLPVTAPAATVPATPPTATPSTYPAPPPPPPAFPPGPMPPTHPQAQPAVSGLTVPRVLLALGAFSLLVAGSWFLAITWALLGVTGRTVVLLLLTTAAGVVTARMAARDLRAATEALGAVTLGLFAFDLLGARTSGWLGDPSGPQFAIVLGSLLWLAGTAAAYVVTRTPAGRLVVAEVTAVIGAGTLAGGVAASAWGDEATRLLVAVPVLGLLTAVPLLLRRLLADADADADPGAERAPRRVAPLLTAAVGTAALTALAWLVLLGSAVDRLTGDLTLTGVWAEGGGVPALLAGVYVALLAAPLVPLTSIRVGALAAAVVPWGLVVLAPALDESATTVALAVTAAVLVLAAVLALAPLPWARAAGAAALVATPVVAATTLALLARAGTSYAEAAAAGWTGTPGGRFTTPVGDGLPAPWVLPLQALALVAVGVAAVRAWRGTHLDRRTTGALALGAAVVGGCGWLLLVPTPVWVALVLLLAVATATSFAALRTTGPARAALTGVAAAAGVLALLLSAYDEWHTLAATLTLIVPVAWRHRPSDELTEPAGALLGLLGAGALWTTAALVDAPGEWSALLVLLALGAWLVAREALADRGLLGVELGVAGAAVATTLRGVALAPPTEEQTWLAVYLTVLGVVATTVALVVDDRRRVGWLGGALLALASWVRLADLGVSEPEPYTLPSAAALLVVGWVHLRRHPDAGTMSAWSPGLGLALVPSLLWVLADPVSLRGLVLGLVCLALVLGGAARRWAAPFVWGAAVGAVEVLRLVGPPAMEFSPFLVFGLGGLLLVVVGVTWEQRVHDAQRARDYLRGLR